MEGSHLTLTICHLATMTTTGDKMDAAVLTVTNVSVTSLSTADDTSATSTPGSNSSSTQSIPVATISQSAEYRHRLAEITARATVTDPLNIVFQQEKTGKAVPVTPDLLYLAAKTRIDTKVAAGASVAEACNFAAVACWEPPVANPPQFTEAHFHEMAQTRPVFADFVREIQRTRLACLGADQPHWMLSLMARDPERKDKGAVRAVIEPFVARAKTERVPLWLVAGNPRARDVYAYFGFRVVHVIWSYPRASEQKKGEGGSDGKEEGVPTWCMVCNWPVE